MSILELVCWVVVLCASIVGIVSKDWRAYAVTLGASVFALVMAIAHAWK